ncbi:hypothetical protein [uncultured Polaribacter sp.]|uniref:hypothetical protein n=1 Tax=uncultured Polaribacter sp. TaxID=174711 RepID=UPI002606A012|nr:hypothetical protein [uncultured Polaribacter sp.]
MKIISKKSTITMFLLAGLVAAVNAQETTTVTTPCGVYKIDNVKTGSSNIVTTGNSTTTTTTSSSNVSVNSSTSNGVTKTKIFVNGKLYKEVSCKAEGKTTTSISSPSSRLKPLKLPKIDNSGFFSSFPSFSNLFSSPFFNF